MIRPEEFRLPSQSPVTRLDGPRTFVAVYITLVAVALLINTPGRPNHDTMVMLHFAQHPAELNDWHAPFGTFVFGLLGPVLGWRMGALVVQSLLLLTWPAMMLAVVLRRPSGPKRWALLLILTPVVCLQLVLVGLTIKDVLGLAFASVAFAAVVARDHDVLPLTSRQVFSIAAAAVAGFALLRPSNLAVAAAGLVTYALFFGGRGARLRSLGLSVGVIAASLAAIFIVPALLGARDSNPEQASMVFDLAGMSTVLHEDLFADVLPPDAARQPPWDCYRPTSADTFFWGKCETYGHLIDPIKAKLKWVWLRKLAAHPMAYLAHRRQFAAALLLVDHSRTLLPNPPYFYHATNDFGLVRITDLERDTLIVWHASLAFVPFDQIAFFVLCRTIVGLPLTWVVLLSVLPLVCIPWAGRDIVGRVAVLSAAGLTNLFVILAIGPSDDVRYLLPTFWCALAATLLLCVRQVGPPPQVRRG